MNSEPVNALIAELCENMSFLVTAVKELPTKKDIAEMHSSLSTNIAALETRLSMIQEELKLSSEQPAKPTKEKKSSTTYKTRNIFLKDMYVEASKPNPSPFAERVMNELLEMKVTTEKSSVPIIDYVNKKFASEISEKKGNAALEKVAAKIWDTMTKAQKDVIGDIMKQFHDQSSDANKPDDDKGAVAEEPKQTSSSGKATKKPLPLSSDDDSDSDHPAPKATKEPKKAPSKSRSTKDEPKETKSKSKSAPKAKSKVAKDEPKETKSKSKSAPKAKPKSKSSKKSDSESEHSESDVSEDSLPSVKSDASESEHSDDE